MNSKMKIGTGHDRLDMKCLFNFIELIVVFVIGNEKWDRIGLENVCSTSSKLIVVFVKRKGVLPQTPLSMLRSWTLMRQQSSKIIRREMKYFKLCLVFHFNLLLEKKII